LVVKVVPASAGRVLAEVPLPVRAKVVELTAPVLVIPFVVVAPVTVRVPPKVVFPVTPKSLIPEIF
jgi:hypothetical protein